MSRFVVLEHDHPVLHWDLMLEAGQVLQTWRLAQAPEVGTAAIEATALGDHRLVYVDYEGPVAGDRGTVKRWDAGDFLEDADSAASARRFTLHGKRIAGRVCLERVEETRWQFSWVP